jgi:hypothetical protein
VIDVLAGVATTAALLPLGNWLYWKFEGASRRAPQPEAALALK